MSATTYGPVDLYLIGFDGERPDPSVVEALLDVVESGIVRIVDALVLSADVEGNVSAIEVTETEDAFGLGELELTALGVAGDEDIEQLGSALEPGTSALLIALELAFARTLVNRLGESGAVVLSANRIPAPVVNAIADLAEADADDEI